MAEEGVGQAPHGGPGVGHHDLGDADRERVLDHQCDRPGRDRGGGVVVAVGVLALERAVERTGSDDAAVVLDGGDRDAGGDPVRREDVLGQCGQEYLERTRGAHGLSLP